MGRNIRRVPPNWEHPKMKRWDWKTQREIEDYHPMYDQSCEEAWQEWFEAWQEWLKSGHDEAIAIYGDEYPKNEPYKSFCEYHGTPPNPDYYRPNWNEDTATWYQVYETVSEGTPVSPPFETKEELAEYLAQNGDFWDQKRRQEGDSLTDNSPWGKERAERFVFGTQWMPSAIGYIIPTDSPN